MKKFLSVLFFFTMLASSAQTIILKGKAEHLPGELVRLIVYEDQFSHLDKTLAATYCDSKGNFSLQAEVDQTTFAFLAVGLKRGEFYLKPGADYTFEIIPDNSEPGSIFDEIPLQFELTANDGGLNDAIGKFNEQYNRFVYENTNRIYKNRDKRLVRDFGQAMLTQFGNVSDLYFEQYVRYTLASLEWVSATLSSEQIIETYFSNQEILYYNIQYTDFFSEFFKSYLSSNKVFTTDQVNKAINSATGFASFDALLRTDSLLKDRQLRELASLTLLARKYYSEVVLQNKVMMLLQDIQKNSRFDEIQKVANDYIIKLKQLAYGTPAPGFYLKDENGANVSLKQLEGKFILLNFVKDDCKLCMSQFQQISEILEPIQSKLQIITIVYGKNYSDIYQFLRDRNFNWQVLNLNNDIILLEKYNIRAYPSFVLINPDGTIALATTPMPDELLDLFIKRAIVKYEKSPSQSSGK